MESETAISDLRSMLNKAIARELQVSIQYMFQHSLGTGAQFAVPGRTAAARRVQFVATRRPYFLPGASLKKIAITEMRHAEAIADQVVHLGGEPTTQPAPITLGETIREMLELDREQERGAIELYKQIIDAAEQNGDDATGNLFRRILADEESHHRTFAGFLAED
jgi:bacterioferritin